MVTEEHRIWTLAYRKPTGPWFQRVDLELTWAQAFYAAMSLGVIRPDLVIYYTTTKAYDDERVVRANRFGDPELAEDAHNIMVDIGKRIKIKDTGKLDPRVCVLPAPVARAHWTSKAT